MKKTIRLTESDLIRLVKRVINETDKKKLIQSLIKGPQPKPQSMDMEKELEDVQYTFDIESVECNGTLEDGHVDIDEDTIVIRYCEGDEDSLEYLKKKGKKLFLSRFGL